LRFFFTSNTSLRETVFLEETRFKTGGFGFTIISRETHKKKTKNKPKDYVFPVCLKNCFDVNDIQIVFIRT
jgi:hypothetical protein